jgi:hypothetical protein
MNEHDSHVPTEEAEVSSCMILSIYSASVVVKGTLNHQNVIREEKHPWQQNIPYRL